jgi:ubiquinone/menaquinone biosynthesis C-methylase UbiE
MVQPNLAFKDWLRISGMENSAQRSAFLNGEGDAWFNRNANYEISQFDHVDKEILEHLPPESNILEIGCADGRRLARVQRTLGSYSKLVGIDPSTAAIQEGLAKFEGLDLRVGTADDLPANETFDSVILGFCLYLCDRALLSKIVSEVDRVLIDSGTLIIVDFDPPHPRKRQYRHHEGLWSYKMDYSTLFTALPHFSQSSKKSMSHQGADWEQSEGERIAVWVLKKHIDAGYSLEADD